MSDEYYWVKKKETKTGTAAGYEAARVIEELENGQVEYVIADTRLHPSVVGCEELLVHECAV